MTTFREFLVEERQRIPGGMAAWREKIGATSADIAEAMKRARELQSYKDLIALTSEVITPRRQKLGTFAFKNKHNVRFNLYLVHFYGQVRSGTVDGENNAPVSTPNPVIYPGDPIKTMVEAYDTGFKIIKKTFVQRKKNNPDRILQKDIKEFLQDRFNFVSVKIDEGIRRNSGSNRIPFAKIGRKMIVVHNDTMKIIRELSRDSGSFIAALGDDDDIADLAMSKVEANKTRLFDSYREINKDMDAVYKYLKTYPNVDLNLRIGIYAEEFNYHGLLFAQKCEVVVIELTPAQITAFQDTQ